MKSGNLLIGLSLLAFVGGCSAGSDSEGLRVVSGANQPKGIAMAKETMATKQGIPLYPGATAPEGQSTVVEGETQSRYVLQLDTKDPLKKVAAFYKSQIPKLNPDPKNGDADLMGATPSGTLVHIKLGAKGGSTHIEVSAIIENTPKPKS